jgi:hypothetical protein
VTSYPRIVIFTTSSSVTARNSYLSLGKLIDPSRTFVESMRCPCPSNLSRRERRPVAADEASSPPPPAIVGAAYLAALRHNPTSQAALRHLPSHVTSIRVSLRDFRRWFFELRLPWFVPAGSRQLAVKEEAIAAVFSRAAVRRRERCFVILLRQRRGKATVPSTLTAYRTGMSATPKLPFGSVRNVKDGCGILQPDGRAWRTHSPTIWPPCVGQQTG